jgi:hypothetical protein
MYLMTNGNLLVRQVHPEDLRDQMRLIVHRITHVKS